MSCLARDPKTNWRQPQNYASENGIEACFLVSFFKRDRRIALLYATIYHQEPLPKL